MKKILCTLLILALCLGLASAATAQAPAAGSLRAEKQTIRGNSSWTPESYPEIWITPIYAEYIIEGNERYPAHFLRFAPPEGAAPLRIDYDYANFIDFDTLFQYSYQAMSRASFESFLEGAERQEEHTILLDGSNGVAMYVWPDNRRARAMLSISDHFGGTAMLQIEIYDHTGVLSGDELAKLIQDEAPRVQDAMRFEELDRFWAQGVYASVELFYDFDNVNAVVDTAEMTLVRMQNDRLVSKVMADGEVRETDIQIGATMYGDDHEEATLTDGTPYMYKAGEYSSEAFFFIKEGRYDDVYLQIKIYVGPEDFAAELEKVYPLITLADAQ